MAERSPRDPQDPLDEEAAWAQIVAGYGEEPAWDDARREVRAETTDPGEPRTDDERPGPRTKASDAETAAGADGGPGKEATDDVPKAPSGPAAPGSGSPGSFVVYAPGVGPRDWSSAEPSEADFDESDEDDEGHFTPPEPPPLPQADVTTKFAWIAVLGGPLLLVLMVLFQQPVTWWITVLGIGGFLGGFATLIARMKGDDEDDDGPTPGSGAVV
ncbi:hypothetical protein [Streptomyces benahoarensis]|uniref:DUF308 domain-containing protein n=1 Tax=Streptomyces benahoarensis TaxID=2595054 RepID=A0A553Z3Q0_9ACTN|nr:hypothetical protein [Streptomyces benahoarensis]TSB21093.1 hypothetical protein FNJ62_20005 [Streptomyces benahoarensis]TSB36024.1 hypothetical protein FNZ23_20385 [Streptomyces benahoarensis]